MTDTPDIFLSYSKRDQAAAREVAAALEARGQRTWPDEQVPDRHDQVALEEVIQAAGSALVLIGEDGLEPSREIELRACLDQMVERRMVVTPVLLPEALPRSELPAPLQQFTSVDLRDGLTEAELDRLIWGITGREPEALKAQRGRRLWLAVVVLGAVVLALIVVTLLTS